MRAALAELRWPALRILASAAFIQLIPLGTAVAIGFLVELANSTQRLHYAWGTLVLVQVALAAFFTTLGHSVAASGFSARLQARLTRTAIKRLLSAEYGYLRSRPHADLVDRVAGIQNIQSAISGVIIGSVLDLFSLVAYSTILILVAPPVGIGMLAVLALYFSTLWILSSALIDRAFVAAQASGAQRSFGVQAVSTAETIKTLRTEAVTAERWMQKVHLETEANYRLSVAQGHLSAFAVAVQWGVPLAVTAFGVGLVQDKQLSLGALVAVQTLLGTMLASSTAMTFTLQQLFATRANLARVHDIFQARGELGPEQTSGKLATFDSAMELSNVGYKYDGSLNFAVRGVNARVLPGQTLAVVGRTGSGKSSLIRVILSLERATEGHVAFDGVPLPRLSAYSVRGLFAVVSQNPAITAGTIRENLELANQHATTADLWRALEIADLRAEIAATPSGLDTNIGDGGDGLSGGQRQRLAIARAVVGQSKVLVLDEATASLDEETEERVFSNLQSMRKTLVVVSHRPTIIRHADLVIDLDSGPPHARPTRRGRHAAQAEATEIDQESPTRTHWPRHGR